MKHNPNMVIFGPPGAGKDTQLDVLMQHLDIEPIITGEIIREMIKSDTPIAKSVKETIARGDLVNDAMMEIIIKDRLSSVEKSSGIIVDGYPRTIKQAETLNILLAFIGRKLNKVLFLDVPEDVLINRLTQRKICVECGSTAFPSDEKCTKCGGLLEKRIDDNLDSVKARISNYKRKTEPITNFYEKRGLLLRVNGDQSRRKVSEDILEGLHID